MALFTLSRFFKVFSLRRAEAFFKDFASQDCSVDGIYVSFPRNGIGKEQVECHCHLPAKGDVAFQCILFIFFFLFVFPALTQVERREQVSSSGSLVGGVCMWSFQFRWLAYT